MKHLELKKCLLIGASTGGPGQIEKIIRAIAPLQSTVVIIAQHMLNGFIPSFISRLEKVAQNPISMVEDGLHIQVGHIYVCSGDTRIIQHSSQLHFTHQKSSHGEYNPNINSLFDSFVSFSNTIETMAVILTGIGDDGVDGCARLSLNGAKCMTENEQSSIVDGMPSRARAVVPNIKVAHIEEIIQHIKEFAQ